MLCCIILPLYFDLHRNNLCMSTPLKTWQPDSWPSLTFAIHHSTGTMGLMPFTSHNLGNIRAVPATLFFHPACCSSSSVDPVNCSSSMDGSIRAAAMKGKRKHASFKTWWNSFSPLTTKHIEKYNFLPADGVRAARFEQKELDWLIALQMSIKMHRGSRQTVQIFVFSF